jgi:hypothetical protein
MPNAFIFSFSAWVQLLDRRQQHLELVLIPFESFVPSGSLTNGHGLGLGGVTGAGSSMVCPYRVIYSCMSDTWVNVTNMLKFLPTEEPDHIKFIWASEDTGFRHLNLVKAIKTCSATSEFAEMDCTGKNLGWPPFELILAVACRRRPRIVCLLSADYEVVAEGLGITF